MTDSHYLSQIAEIQLATGWTKRQLAARLTVHPTTLSTWLAHTATPHPRALAKIATLYAQLIGSHELIDLLPAERRHLLAQKTTAKKILADKYFLRIFTEQFIYHTQLFTSVPTRLVDIRRLLEQDRCPRGASFSSQLAIKNQQLTLRYLLTSLAESGRRFHWSLDFLLELHRHLATGLTTTAGQLRQTNDITDELGQVRPARGARRPHLPARLTQLTTTLNHPPSDPLTDLAAILGEIHFLQPFTTAVEPFCRLLLVGRSLQLGLLPPLLIYPKKPDYLKALTHHQRTHQLRPLTLLIADGLNFTAQITAQPHD